MDGYRDRFGTELICRVLGNTARGFVTSRGSRAANSCPMSDCAVGDQVIGDEIEGRHAQNFSAYGVRRGNRLMLREGWLVGRGQAARFIKTRGIMVVKRGKTTVTTQWKKRDTYPADKVQRRFVADWPNHSGLRTSPYATKWGRFAHCALRIGHGAWRIC